MAGEGDVVEHGGDVRAIFGRTFKEEVECAVGLDSALKVGDGED